MMVAGRTEERARTPMAALPERAMRRPYSTPCTPSLASVPVA